VVETEMVVKEVIELETGVLLGARIADGKDIGAMTAIIPPDLENNARRKNTDTLILSDTRNSKVWLIPNVHEVAHHGCKEQQKRQKVKDILTGSEFVRHRSHRPSHQTRSIRPNNQTRRSGLTMTFGNTVTWTWNTSGAR
jgi:hypothetical protein